MGLPASDTPTGPHHNNPHAEYHRQAATHFGATAPNQPGFAHADPDRAYYTAPPQPAWPPPPPAGASAGAAPPQNTPFTGDAIAQWLAAPGHLKLVAGVAGGFVALMLFLTGGPGVKIPALLLAIAVWALCFRQGYHEKAGLRAQTPVAADQAIRIAVDAANSLRGPLSSVEFTGSTADRANFTVRGSTWKPLEFHVTLRPDPSGWTFVSTHLDRWTWRRNRVNFIPVPLTKRMDGYGLYKSFGDRLLKALQQHHQSTNGAFKTRPQ
ncbi:hypothetical protein MYSE111917_24525 [Mycobacterium senriense]